MSTEQTTLHTATILELTRRAMEGAIAIAHETKPDKLAWAPNPEARNVRDIMWELAECSVWFSDAILKQTSEHLTWEQIAPKLRERAPESMSLDDLCDALRNNTEVFLQACQNLTDDQLDKPLPGSDWAPTPRDLVYFPLRNFWYHCGQIGYIQTCYGDFGM